MLRKCTAIVTAALALLVAACGPAPAGSSASPVADQPRAPKSLILSQDFEPPDIEGFGSLVRPAGSGTVKDIVHNHLVRKVRDGVIEPELAEVPSFENGTWRVNADNSMDLTWKLRPNIKWHDGTPFTSADMLFSFEVFKNPALPPTSAAPTLRSMESASAPDDTTFVVHWSQIDVTAQEGIGLIQLSRQAFQDLYTTDKDAFVNSLRFRNEFVGLGPYRLVNWELGTFIELTRFYDYYQGRPPLDRVVVRFIDDANAIVANLLSGTIDIAVRPRMDLSSALELKGRWEAAGNQAWIEPSTSINFAEAQRRPDLARPRNGLTNPLVRRAFLMGLDRQTLSDVLTAGLGPLADSYVTPDDPMRPEVERFIAGYPYDPLGAARLLAEAGWNRGADGLLVHKDTGELFESEVWGSPELINKQEPEIFADSWRALGAKLTTYNIPMARSTDRELAASSPLLTVSDGGSLVNWYHPDRLYSKFIAAPANSFGSRNKFGYVNPRVDELMERLVVTIDPRARVDLHRQLLEEETRDVAFFPIYWNVGPIFAARGVNPAPSRPISLANFAAWTRD